MSERYWHKFCIRRKSNSKRLRLFQARKRELQKSSDSFNTKKNYVFRMFILLLKQWGFLGESALGGHKCPWQGEGAHDRCCSPWEAVMGWGLSWFLPPVWPHAGFIEAAINAELLIMPCSPPSGSVTASKAPCPRALSLLGLQVKHQLDGFWGAPKGVLSICLLLLFSPGNNSSSSLWVDISIFPNIPVCSSRWTADLRAGNWIIMSHNTGDVPLIPEVGQSAPMEYRTVLCTFEILLCQLKSSC